MVRVRLLGTPSVELDGEAVTLPPGRPGALLGWLALHPGDHARRELAGRFWPDVLDDSAAACAPRCTRSAARSERNAS